MAGFRIKSTLEEPNGRKFDVVGTGATRAAALAEYAAKMAMHVGDIVPNSHRESGLLPAGDVGVPNAGASGYSNAIIVLRKSGLANRPVRLDNVTNDIAIPDTDGLIDPTNALVAAYVAAFRDGDGEGGYAFLSGYFIR